jgi:hypothetical protein
MKTIHIGGKNLNFCYDGIVKMKDVKSLYVYSVGLTSKIY